MRNSLKFDARRCLDYINNMNDFEVEFERKPCMEPGGMPVYQAERISMKAFLKKFIVECSEWVNEPDYSFLQWLNERKLFYKNQQYRVVGSLTDRIARAKGEDRTFLMKRRDLYENFFVLYYNFIEKIEEDVLSKVEHVVDKVAFGSFIDLPGSTEKLHRKKTGTKLVQQDLALLCALDDVDINLYVEYPSRKLLQHCNMYKDKRKRTEVLPEMSITIAENVFKRFKRVLPHLTTEEGKNRGKEELEIVRKKIAETHFEK